MKIYRDKDPITKEVVYKQTHSDAVIFGDGETLTQKMGGGGSSVATDAVYTEDITSMIPAMWCNVSGGSLSDDSYITVENDQTNPQNAVVTVVKNQTQGRFGWYIGRPLPINVKIDVDVAYNGTGSTQAYYSTGYRTVVSYIEGTTINSNVTHLSFIVNNVANSYVGFQVTGLQAGQTITFSNFRASYYSSWDEYFKWIDIDYNTEKLLKVATQNMLASSSALPPLSLIHFSDIHGDPRAASYIRRFYDRNSTIIDDMLCTGDIVTIKFGDNYEFYERNLLDDALFTLGNHDGASADSQWVGQDRGEVYNRYMAKVSDWGVVQPTDASTNYLFYYYKDYADSKVRLICLDCVHHGNWETIEGEDAAQLAWFQARLNEVLDSSNSAYGYKVVVASHYVPGEFTMSTVVKNSSGEPANFGSNTWELSSVSFPYAVVNDAYPTAIDSFITSGGKFVVWLCGHYHTSGLAYLTAHPNILIHAIDQAGTMRNHSLYREAGTPTEIACANVVVISDTLYRCIRVGYHQDQRLRSIKSMCYDWVSKKVISEQ